MGLPSTFCSAGAASSSSAGSSSESSLALLPVPYGPSAAALPCAMDSSVPLLEGTASSAGERGQEGTSLLTVLGATRQSNIQYQLHLVLFVLAAPDFPRTSSRRNSCKSVPSRVRFLPQPRSSRSQRVALHYSSFIPRSQLSPASHLCSARLKRFARQEQGMSAGASEMSEQQLQQQRQYTEGLVKAAAEDDLIFLLYWLDLLLKADGSVDAPCKVCGALRGV